MTEVVIWMMAEGAEFFTSKSNFVYNVTHKFIFLKLF